VHTAPPPSSQARLCSVFGLLLLALFSCAGSEIVLAQGPSEAVKDLNESRLVDLRSQVARLIADLGETKAALVAAVASQTHTKRRHADEVASVSSLSAALEGEQDDAQVKSLKARLKEAKAQRDSTEDALALLAKREKDLTERLEDLGQKLRSSREGLERQQTWMSTRFRPELPQEELRAFLRPLTRAELEVELAAWIRLVQQKVAAISANELWLAANKTGTGTGRTTAELDERTAALVLLQDDRAKLVDRARHVLTELRLKGSKPEALEESEAYLGAVSGIQLDTSDSRTTVIAIWNWLKAEEGGLRWGKNLLAFVVILTVTFVLSRILGWSAARASRIGSGSDLLEETVSGLVRKGVFLIGGVMALSALEINTTPLMAALGGAALVIGLALQGTLANFAAGLLIVAYRPFDRGSLVEAAGVLGKVQEVTMLTTTIVTPDNKRVVVPNGMIWNGTITNLTGLPTRRVDLVVGVGYGSDLDLVQRTLEALVAESPKVLEIPSPTIEVHELADSSVNFVVRPWCKTDDYWDVYWGLTRAVKLRFDELGIEIPFPQRELHLPSSGSPLAASEPALAPPAEPVSAEPATPASE
jgi:small conductance mechanosensitive channel